MRIYWSVRSTVAHLLDSGEYDDRTGSPDAEGGEDNRPIALWGVGEWEEDGADEHEA